MSCVTSRLLSGWARGLPTQKPALLQTVLMPTRDSQQPGSQTRRKSLSLVSVLSLGSLLPKRTSVRIHPLSSVT